MHKKHDDNGDLAVVDQSHFPEKKSRCPEEIIEVSTLSFAKLQKYAFSYAEIRMP